MDYIVDTIMVQIKWQILRLKGFHFVRMSDVAVLVCKGNKNLCIRYNKDSDLYDLSKITKQEQAGGKPEEIKDVCCDQLVNIVAEYFNIEDKAYRYNFDICGDTDTVTCVICGKPIRQGCESIVCGTDVNGSVHMQCLIARLAKRL